MMGKTWWWVRLGLASLACVLSIEVTGSQRITHPTCGNIDGIQTCDLVTGGWPVAFVRDGPFSPVGSVDLLGVALGLDEVLWPQLALNGLCWLAGFTLLGGLFGRRR